MAIVMGSSGFLIDHPTKMVSIRTINDVITASGNTVTFTARGDLLDFSYACPEIK